MFAVRTYGDFNPNKKYEYNIAVGYWLSGIKIDSQGNKKEIDQKKSKKILLDSLNILSKNNKNALFTILDDCSPIPIPEVLDSLEGNPVIVVQLLQNQGVGGKENILQSISKKFSDFYFRFDADVKFTKCPVDSLRKAFQDCPNLGMAVINAGFLGAMTCGKKDGPNYVQIKGAVGNGAMVPTKIFNQVGFSDPTLRYFEDVDMAIRIYSQGYRIVMVQSAQGTTTQSGAGTEPGDRPIYAQYLQKLNPGVKVSYNSNGMPIIRWESTAFAYRRTLPSSPLSMLILNKLRDKKGLVI